MSSRRHALTLLALLLTLEWRVANAQISSYDPNAGGGDTLSLIHISEPTRPY